MNKVKLFLIKVGLIPAPEGFKYTPLDTDKDGKVQEGTSFERNVKVVEKKPIKKAAAKKATAKKATKKAK